MEKIRNKIDRTCDYSANRVNRSLQGADLCPTIIGHFPPAKTPFLNHKKKLFLILR